MRGFVVMMAAVPLLATGGCVRTAWNVATLPVKAVGKGADVMTTSPKERDEKYVRQQRKQAERDEKERREREKACRKHPDRCEAAPGYAGAVR
ncbi:MULTISPECIES: hypothetical protein [unclassified Sphingomonas]|uniref:hypothetical protein n=1 Tax=unclassified Sphingomonas TaxID=196159 RepID=UPI00161A58E6|nr:MULTISPECIES: hypothetical protein [unclassified Sphingomonas]MBB3346635.1 hypothetical protein [Sphingomonas sp. BK069]MBB3473049.1 hypothetical protein [Sphingomonas sp. BK345]